MCALLSGCKTRSTKARFRVSMMKWSLLEGNTLSTLCILAITDVTKLASMIVGHLGRDLLSVFSVDRIAKTARPVKGYPDKTSRVSG
jgi:hypothetical protein